MPEPGQEETVRIVALDRSFHIGCYKCEVKRSPGKSKSFAEPGRLGEKHGGKSHRRALRLIEVLFLLTGVWAAAVL